MAKAYVLAKVQTGRETEIRKALAGDECVKELDFVYGQYDLIMKVEAAGVEGLDEFIFERLRRLPGVHETMPLIAAHVP